jgi:hypothetical protein
VDLEWVFIKDGAKRNCKDFLCFIDDLVTKFRRGIGKAQCCKLVEKVLAPTWKIRGSSAMILVYWLQIKPPKSPIAKSLVALNASAARLGKMRIQGKRREVA